METEYTFDEVNCCSILLQRGRIDFRDLVKDLANIFKIQIELRQIGVRDEARILGTIGLLRKENFVVEVLSINLIPYPSKWQEIQGLVINPTKISKGFAGDFYVVSTTEYKQYEEALRRFRR